MDESQNERAMYRELQDQWSNLQGEINPSMQRSRNSQPHPNAENFHQIQDHLMQTQYMPHDLYATNNIFANKVNENTSNLGERHNNYNENMFINQGANYDVNNIQNPQSYACLDLGNGQLVKTKVIYDENNQPQYMVPLNNYEVYSQVRHNMALQPNCLPMIVSCAAPVHPLPPEAAMLPRLETAPFGRVPPLVPPPPPEVLPLHYTQLMRNHAAPQEANAESGNVPNVPSYEQPSPAKSHLIDNFLGNWTSNPSGTYTPFGHTYLNVQSNIPYQREPPLSLSTESPAEILSELDPETFKSVDRYSRKEPEGILCAESSGKKRMVAEVKPMRPSYSAVLAKTPKGPNNPEISKKKLNGKEQNKNNAKPGLTKLERCKSINPSGEKPIITDEKMKKTEINRKNTFQTQLSSGSESGETNIEFSMKYTKTGKKNKCKGDNMNRKWVSLDDLSNDNDHDIPMSEEQPGYTNCDSDFVFVSQSEERNNAKKRNAKKTDGCPKKSEKPEPTNSEEVFSKDSDQFVYQETVNDNDKTKKRNKDTRSSSGKPGKLNSEKNKKGNQSKYKKSKGAEYVGLLQNYMDNWISIMITVMFWFYNLLSDICRMSAHLSVDLFSSMCTEMYIWTQNVWILMKEQATNTQWLCNFGSYMDKKFGHTWFGFWRRLKWFKSGLKSEGDGESHKKSNFNIPLPATGDDAMKRLLACKGKDPYSILGVGVQCTDDDIKRYYRRQAFLVHPDKNQQPGAEEAFKILQHAFDLIGEPERREAYDRKLLESQHVEAAWSELSELLAQLHDKVRHAAGTIRCTNCTRRHKRTLTARPCYAARYCAQCKIHHSAKEGDIWAESSFWGLAWMYYACMDGAVYEITQWASCQKKNLKHLKANTHHVQYRIVLGNKSQQSGPTATGKPNPAAGVHDANLEDFLNNLYTKAGQSTSPGAPGKNMPTNSNQTGETTKSKRKPKKNVKI